MRTIHDNDKEKYHILTKTSSVVKMNFQFLLRLSVRQLGTDLRQGTHDVEGYVRYDGNSTGTKTLIRQCLIPIPQKYLKV